MSEILMKKILDGGGVYLPILNAFDFVGWGIITGKNPDTIARCVKRYKIPYREFGDTKFITTVDFWSSLKEVNFEQAVPQQ